MNRIVDFRAVVQRDDTTKNKYRLRFLKASISESFPWSPPEARIEIATNVSSGTAGYISPIRADDIIRLQANVRYSETEKTVWEDIFEGRIIEISSAFNESNNNTNLVCRGHAEEALCSLVTADYSASSATTGTIAEALRTLYMGRLSTGQIDTTSSTTITSYNVKGNTKYISDVFKQLEQLEGYGYQFKSVPTYDADGNLSTVYASWQPLSSTVSSNVAIIEGTDRFVSSQFSSSIASLINDVTIFGATGTPQKTGTATDATSKTNYGTRCRVETDQALATDALCEDIADEILARYKDPIVSGSAQILGEVHVHPGDLVYCKIPSLEINGASIDGNYRVRGVTHSINAEEWVTDLDLGDIQLSASDIIIAMRDGTRLNNSNLIT